MQTCCTFKLNTKIDTRAKDNRFRLKLMQFNKNKKHKSQSVFENLVQFNPFKMQCNLLRIIQYNKATEETNDLNIYNYI